MNVNVDQVPYLKFKNEVNNEELMRFIEDKFQKDYSVDNLAEFTGAFKNELDSKFGNGWIVFAGKHMTGCCSYVVNTLADFEVNETCFVIFQTLNTE